MKSAATGQWWSEEKLSEIRSCFLSDWNCALTQGGALFRITSWHLGNKKKIHVKKEKKNCKCWTIKSFLSSTTSVWIYTHEIFIFHWEAFPEASIAHSFIIVPPEWTQCFLSVCSSLTCTPSPSMRVCENYTSSEKKNTSLCTVHAENCFFPLFFHIQMEVLLMHNWVLRI